MKCYALIPCAGVGQRAGAAGPKQYAPVAGRPLVLHTVEALAAVPRLIGTLVVLAPDDETFDRLVPARPGLWSARCGGATRAATVRAGLDALRAQGAGDDDWVLVHDAARCLLTAAAVDRLIDACIDDPVGGLLALPLTDTLKQAMPDAADRAAATVDRHGKWAAQTPQMFHLAQLARALDAAGDAVTDEASAIEALGLQPRLVPGDPDNLKVTWPADFARAEQLMERRMHPTTALPALRIGEGWDTHALVVGRPLVLGGVTIPHSHGLLGHSDADALLHAITDALLGAAGLGDIGRHFPDTDPAFAGADSAVLLQEAARRVRAAGWLPVNVDSTIVAQAPKMAPHIAAMRERIAALLGLAEAAVNVKAKTAEKMGPVGEGRSIETRAVCLLVRASGATSS
ncbi:2-C-methyl-D-erythritol 4-phosphate cytidylyltransferase [Rubrivivax albus]|uniref:Bifunctional enzyme IspD/IspF n=1 Tax=Rubrivivax albus TaxID=2499835 RepID=A0A437JNH5_9BURK|nr:2-C-methyl-D-erythritol 4-phosphate cytidylyltransferase [Rubrivivax albus]RVT48407.1 2-C-methyl-D-erythritol 4-phosphate cytidylyltransferase [Rubrivivax albus]